MSTAPVKVRKAKATAKAVVPTCLSRGSGMTAGLEIWRVGTTLHLYDRTPDNRFAADVTTWTVATGGLNAMALQTIKDAGTSSTSSEFPRENPASSRASHTRA
jgi:hypothetical protein